MIVVTGATGNVGRPLVAALRSAGAAVRAVSRSIEPEDVPAGVAIHRADLAALAPALTDADSLFLLTAAGFLATGDLAEVMSVVDAAGVRRVVLLSSQGVGTGHHPPVLEDAVTSSGLEWTVLRPSGFHSNALQWSESIRTRRMAAAPFGDVALPAIDPRDIAEVAAAVLRNPGHGGRTYELTGPEPISPRAQTAAIAEAVGEPVQFVELTGEEAKARMLHHMPEPVAESTLAMLGTPTPALRRTSPDAARILGREPRPFADWATHNTQAFK